MTVDRGQKTEIFEVGMRIDIICILSIAIWDFSAISGKVNCFYLNQLELILTFPCIMAYRGFSFLPSMV